MGYSFGGVPELKGLIWDRGCISQLFNASYLCTPVSLFLFLMFFSPLIQHKTIDSVLARGEKLDSLVEKSSDLSAASQVCNC